MLSCLVQRWFDNDFEDGDFACVQRIAVVALARHAFAARAAYLRIEGQARVALADPVDAATDFAPLIHARLP